MRKCRQLAAGSRHRVPQRSGHTGGARRSEMANRLWRIDPGFDPRNLLTMTISLPNNKFEWRHNVVFSRQVIRSLEAMPEVRGAAVIQGVPMREGSFYGSFTIEGKPNTPVDRPSARLRVVSP